MIDNLVDPDAGDAARSFRVRLENGLDGERPGPGEYEGDEDAEGNKSGLRSFEDVEELSIVAAPGSTFGLQNGFGAEALVSVDRADRVYARAEAAEMRSALDRVVEKLAVQLRRAHDRHHEHRAPPMDEIFTPPDGGPAEHAVDRDGDAV